MTGCNVFDDIENWIPVGEAAFEGIITLLKGAGLVDPIITGLVGTILTSFNDLLAAVKAYEAINPPPVGALAKIQAIFSLIISNFENLLGQISSNPIVSTVIGLAQIILSTIAGFVNKLPANSSVTLSNTFKVSNQTVSYIPQYRTIGAFKKAYNKVALAEGHPEIELKLTLAEHF